MAFCCAHVRRDFLSHCKGYPEQEAWGFAWVKRIGELAEIMFTIFATLNRWSINPHTWLITYLQECAFLGKAPDRVNNFLPWNMTEKQKRVFSEPPIGENSS